MKETLSGTVVRAGRLNFDGEVIDGLLVEVSADAFKAYKPNLLYQWVGIRIDNGRSPEQNGLELRLAQSEKATADYRLRIAVLEAQLIEDSKQIADSDALCQGYRKAILQLSERMTAEARKFNECAKHHGQENRAAQAVADRAAEMLLRFAAQAREGQP